MFDWIDRHSNDIPMLLFHAPFGIKQDADRIHVVGVAHGVNETLNVLDVVDIRPTPLIHPFAYLVKHNGAVITPSI